MRMLYPLLRAPRRFRAAAISIAVLLGIAACAGMRSATPADSAARADASAVLRTMTFNIRYGTAPDGEHEWTRRRDLTFRVVRDFAPGVLGVQEALRFQLDEIRRALPHFDEIGVGRDDGLQRGEYSAILFDRRRLAPLRHGTFWLSDTPAVPGSMSWGNRYPRLVTWAEFRDRVSAATFFVFNTHWDHEAQNARERSAALTLDSLRTIAANNPVLLMGDFNAGEDNAAFRRLLADTVTGSSRLYDTFRALHSGATRTGTYHAFRGDRSGPKIDAILASTHWQTLDAGIVLAGENGRFPSDHFPVTATLQLRARAPPPRP